MSEKLKSEYASIDSKFSDAHEKLKDAQRLEWHVTFSAVWEMACHPSYIGRLLPRSLDYNPDNYVGYMRGAYVYMTDKLADGLAELVDLDNGDTVTISVKDD